MKKLFSLSSILSVLVFTLILSACGKEETFEAPRVNNPEAISVVQGEAIEVTFNYNTDAGFKSSSVSSTNGSAAITTDGTADSKSGTIVVTFNATGGTGAAAVVLSITDKKDLTDDATAVVTVVEEQKTFIVGDNISQNTTWETGKTYILGGRIAVTAGATLTIQQGVVVKGEAGSGPNATALIIARGGKLMAEGKAEAPIIFTSVADEITPEQVAAGDFRSPNLDPDLDGLWGGLIILGNAPISAENSPMQIEGIPPSDQNGLYGGNDANDHSGEIRYISIRHGGANIGEGNEINGLTMGGVGAGTVIEYVEVIANQDDGLEWFGGTVDVSHVLVWNSGDDALDTDQAWAGTMDNFVLIAGATTDHALEIDGPEGSHLDAHIIKNGSVKGYPTAELGDFRDGARGTFENIYFFNFTSPAASDGRGDLSLSGTATNDNFAGGILVFNNLEVTLPADTELSDVFKHGTHVHASNVAKGQNTVGADISKFKNWTWADQAGELADFE